ncbi:MAG: OB-fold domain-containing protein [Acidimicrobiia bacterium]|nr:OB-fold domain-containing protein [Acidimicrobiia bacterium]
MLEPQPTGIPVPNPSPASKPYWEGCKRGELRYQRCDDCGTIALRPATVCGHCLSRSLSWPASSGKGALYSWTVVWRPQQPSFTVPYAPAIVTLDEGFRMVSSIVGCEPDDLSADMALAVEFHPASDEIFLPYFRPRP